MILRDRHARRPDNCRLEAEGVVADPSDFCVFLSSPSRAQYSPWRLGDGAQGRLRRRLRADGQDQLERIAKDRDTAVQYRNLGDRAANFNKKIARPKKFFQPGISGLI
jgi:hypothetical protein